ncbi:M13 family metallopeptidase [Mesoterricola sediminis]|uniref:Zinc metalloprotease n=1 Tax=Mesoterricola sediminis TaxID=2927980 RepID=A0AA48GUD7_9BACT|nr:M13 family metallopeptidase [Mesoterricola sediminis]BDU77949.1 zinc metalloprotease [Mesoterricola sediminis]
MSRHGILLALAAGALVLSAPLAARAPETRAAVKAQKPTLGTFGIDLAGMDTAVAPGDDFNGYVNGQYVRKLEIPADKASFGMFHVLHDLSQERTKGIVEAAAAAKGARKGSEAQKVGDFYSSFMDEATIEKKGLAPLKTHLDAIAAIKDPQGLALAFGKAMRQGMDLPVGMSPMQDLKNPAIYSVYVGQGGLGMPDRDYYDVKIEKFKEIRTKYQAHLAAMLKLAGLPDAEARAKAVYDLETKIAASHWTKVQSRQVDKLYNPCKVDELDAKYPGVDWKTLLASVGVASQKELVVTTPSAIEGAARLMASEPLAVWKDYLTVHTLKGAAAFLPKAFVEENFAFNGKVLMGQPEMQPRWKRGVDMTTAVLGEAVGKLYVAKYFPPEAKKQADALVQNLIAAFDQHLANLPWMDAKTKAEARTKLAKFTPKIGYPSKWRDYSRFRVERGDALGNAMRAADFEYQRNLDKIGKPIDRSEWGMTPMTVNAYANPLWNEIVFPAAILQAPFFDPKADPAVNYGAIGVVIGHELSHHFDDQGRKFDKDGKLSDWWTPEDVKRFTALTEKVVKQYADYEPLPGTKVNGELTLGENIADLAGLTMAYDAYHRSLKGKPAPVVGGFTGDQRFFMGFAQVWRTKYRDAALLNQLQNDPHTPGHFRPAVVRNLDAWYEAFGVKPGQKLYLAPADRIKVW